MPRSSNKRIAPAPINRPPAQVHHTVAAPSFGETLKQGFGFGMGSAFAHRIFGATPVVVGPAPAAAAAAAAAAPIPIQQQKSTPEYEQCMKESFNNKEHCKQYLESNGESV